MVLIPHRQMEPIKFNTEVASSFIMMLLLTSCSSVISSAGRYTIAPTSQNYDNKENLPQPSLHFKELNLSSVGAKDEFRSNTRSLLFSSIDQDQVGVHKIDALKPVLSKPDYCIATPQNLSFCSIKLGWSQSMAIPNMLNQKSERELVDMVATWRLNEVISVKCEASHQLKVLLCSILAPTCLDVIIPPCKRTCMATRSSCEPALNYQGLKWPNFLECKRFPRTQEICLSRQPIVVDTSAAFSMENVRHNYEFNSKSSNRTTMKRKRKEKKYKIRLTTTSTTMPSTSTQFGEYKNRLLKESLNSTEQLETSSTLGTVTVSTSIATTITTAVPPTSMITKDTPATTSSPVLSIPHLMPLNANSTDTGSKSHLDPTSSTVAHYYSSMPINVTEDFTQLLCSTSPTWLVKAKLTDSQLLSALARRRLKVKSFRQIFGASPAISKLVQDSKISVARKSTHASSLYLTLSNSTIFVTAMGPNIYTQPLNDALPKPNVSQANLLKSMRYYLIAGTNVPSSSLSKLATVFVVWPNISRSTNSVDLYNQGSIKVINAYRDFKKKGTKVCEETQSSSYFQNSSLLSPALKSDTTILQSDSVAEETINMRLIKGSTRYRNNKKKSQTTKAPM